MPADIPLTEHHFHTNSKLQVADYTASGDLHPALKISFIFLYQYIPSKGMSSIGSYK